MSKVHVKTGDTVIVISGKDKGKKGQVMAVSPKEGKVIVEKVSKVQIYCPRCKKATRVAHKIYEDGTKGRICAKCGEAL